MAISCEFIFRKMLWLLIVLIILTAIEKSLTIFINEGLFFRFLYFCYEATLIVKPILVYWKYVGTFTIFSYLNTYKYCILSVPKVNRSICLPFVLHISFLPYSFLSLTSSLFSMVWWLVLCACNLYEMEGENRSFVVACSFCNGPYSDYLYRSKSRLVLFLRAHPLYVCIWYMVFGWWCICDSVSTICIQCTQYMRV